MTSQGQQVQPRNEIDTQAVCSRLADLLARAEHLLSRAEETSPRPPMSELMDRRLVPDMFSLAEQVTVLADSLTGAAALLTGRDAASVPAAAWVFNRGDSAGLGELPRSLDEARQRLAAARLAVTSMADAPLLPTFQQAETPVVVARQGHVRRFRLAAFVDDYVLPNAYFHLTLIHALLRQAGAPIGKADYEGRCPYTLD